MALWFAEIDADGTEPEERKRNMELLGKLAEYKPLAKIEKMEEQNYNMVDNVLNNGTGEKAQKEENKKAQVVGQSREQSVTLEGGQMAKLLRYIVHTLEIFMWEQDYCLNHDEEDYDPFLEGKKDFSWKIWRTDWKFSPQKSRRAVRHGGCRWSTRTIQSRIFVVITITCQTVQRNCIFHCWNILNQKRKDFGFYSMKNRSDKAGVGWCLSFR